MPWAHARSVDRARARPGAPGSRVSNRLHRAGRWADVSGRHADSSRPRGSQKNFGVSRISRVTDIGDAMANVSPFLVLQARAEARAILWAAGEYADVDEALAPLRAYAVDSGVVEQIGADASWAIINSAFGLASIDTATVENEGADD